MPSYTTGNKKTARRVALNIAAIFYNNQNVTSIQTLSLFHFPLAGTANGVLKCNAVSFEPQAPPCRVFLMPGRFMLTAGRPFHRMTIIY